MKISKRTHILLQSEAIWFMVYGLIITPSILAKTHLFLIPSIILGLVVAHKTRKWYQNREMKKLDSEEKQANENTHNS